MSTGEIGRRARETARRAGGRSRRRFGLAALALALCATPAAAAGVAGPSPLAHLHENDAAKVQRASGALFARPQAPPPAPRLAPRVGHVPRSAPRAAGAPQRSRDEARFSFCVRTCDGYHFPLGDLRADRDLALHEDSCRAACPSAETVLFVSRGSRDVADAVSRTDGAPYTAMPTAFLHRDTRVAACSCERPDGLAQLMSRPDRTLRPGDILVTPEGARVIRRDGALPSFAEPGAATQALRRMIEARLGPNHAAAWRSYRRDAAPETASEPAPATLRARIAPARPALAARPRSGFDTVQAPTRGGFAALN